jgi:hypothetical protein
MSKPITEEERAEWAHLVVHCKKSKHDVYVGRPSKWGNPFKLTDERHRDKVCDQHEKLVLRQNPDLSELRGKVLGCWCAPKRCHAHTLAVLANRH